MTIVVSCNPAARRNLMAVLAHPDDESLGMGGTLAKYAAEGVGVFLLVLTFHPRYHRTPAVDWSHPGYRMPDVITS